ncbi:MAG: hypothetical protein BWY82_03009 [Verrucomicrobia bacterium ADurb.Bin474]|nr:MAG: hypothetical protein BWY82_03009 [Verrucomicrobia bacterium ADurb.Bin474]
MNLSCPECGLFGACLLYREEPDALDTDPVRVPIGVTLEHLEITIGHPARDSECPVSDQVFRARPVGFAAINAAECFDHSGVYRVPCVVLEHARQMRGWSNQMESKGVCVNDFHADS